MNMSSKEKKSNKKNMGLYFKAQLCIIMYMLKPVTHFGKDARSCIITHGCARMLAFRYIKEATCL